jgi:hypothetical protein
MFYFYIIVIVLFIYYTGLYKKLPKLISQCFEIVCIFLPCTTNVNEDIEGVYMSDFKQHGFNKHFMITKDAADDSLLTAIKYRGSKSSTDDPEKLLEKEIREMQKNALDVSYKFKTPVTKTEKGYDIFGTNAKKDGTLLMFEKDGKTVKYSKIRDV